MLHLVFNLLWWWYLGGQIEQRLGGGKLFILLIVGAAPAQYRRVLCQRPALWRPLRGGLCPARLQLAEPEPTGRPRQPPALMGFMLVWLAAGFLDGLHAGHWVGLVPGWLDRHHRTGEAWLPATARQPKRPPTWLTWPHRQQATPVGKTRFGRPAGRPAQAGWTGTTGQPEPRLCLSHKNAAPGAAFLLVGRLTA